MALESDIEVVKARGSRSTTLTNGAEDISGGVTAPMSTGKGAGTSATLFIETQGAVDLTIEFSPDGSAWYEPQSQMPITFSEAGTEVLHMGYDASALKVTASNSTAVNLDLRVTA